MRRIKYVGNIDWHDTRNEENTRKKMASNIDMIQVVHRGEVQEPVPVTH